MVGTAPMRPPPSSENTGRIRPSSGIGRQIPDKCIFYSPGLFDRRNPPSQTNRSHHLKGGLSIHQFRGECIRWMGRIRRPANLFYGARPWSKRHHRHPSGRQENLASVGALRHRPRRHSTDINITLIRVRTCNQTGLRRDRRSIRIVLHWSRWSGRWRSRGGGRHRCLKMRWRRRSWRAHC